MFALNSRRAVAARIAAVAVFVCIQTTNGQEVPDSESLAQPVPNALDPRTVFERVIVGADGIARAAPIDEGTAAGVGERLIYSNTLGTSTINFPSNQPVSDDIATTAPNGCALKRYRFKALGKVLPGGEGGPYTATYALYTTCPLAAGSTNAERDLVKIPGTDGVLSFPDDAPRLIEHVVGAQTPVALPTNVYLSLRFNRGNCGTVVGAPAMIGYSGDVYDYAGFPCNAYLGGFPEYPHASFWVELLGRSDCPQAFVAYKAERPSGPPIGATGPGDVQRVDDAQLIVSDCQMTGYEVAVKGEGTYTFDLRRACNGKIIEGTERVFDVPANTIPQLQVARFNFDPPLALGTDEVYLGFRNSGNTTGAVLAGIKPIIGQSADPYFVLEEGVCQPIGLTQESRGAVNLAITCAGTLPIGACCDNYVTQCRGGPDDGRRCSAFAPCAEPGSCEAVCRQTTELNCPHPADVRPQWVDAQECGPQTFDGFACGIGACCHRSEQGNVCENLTRKECDLEVPLDRNWEPGHCADPPICPVTDFCLAATGSCFVAHNTAGCNHPACCDEICWRGAAGEFCCTVAWDDVCVALAESLCTRPCTPGPVLFLDPPNGVVDARRPHKPHDPGAREGIQAIEVAAPQAVNSSCWSFCLSGGPQDVAISGVTESSLGRYRIELSRPIPAGRLGRLFYRDDNGAEVSSFYVAHPANADGNTQAGPIDILALVDHLNGVTVLPWGLYSGDMDHSGAIGPADILTLIDLLNGANGFSKAWNGTPLPDAEGCP